MPPIVLFGIQYTSEPPGFRAHCRLDCLAAPVRTAA